MLRCLIVAAGLLAAVVVSTAARADATAIIDKLKQTLANLWDLSLVRLEAALAAGAGGRGLMTFAAFEDGRIVMRIYEAEGPSTKAECKKLVDKVKIAGRVDPMKGYPDEPASNYAALFAYPQIDPFSVDESYAETVDSLFDVVAVVGVGGDGTATMCKGPLLSTELIYTAE
ncbi:MAG: hypothetical protein ACOY3L_14525 [Pseudomonadota bacterium]